MTMCSYIQNVLWVWKRKRWTFELWNTCLLSVGGIFASVHTVKNIILKAYKDHLHTSSVPINTCKMWSVWPLKSLDSQQRASGQGLCTFIHIHTVILLDSCSMKMIPAGWRFCYFLNDMQYEKKGLFEKEMYRCYCS